MGKIQVSQVRIEANRRNALRSTGPKTVEGKDASRRNALIHGLAGNGVVMPEAEEKAILQRAAEWNSSLRPYNNFEMYLVEIIATESIRMERCRVEDRLQRDLRARRAQACWVEERTVTVCREARGLQKRPAEVSAQLGRTSPGCDWLIARWRALGHALTINGEWTETQRGLALDLLGVDPDLRDLPGPLDAPDGEDPVDFLQGLVDEELERLIHRQETTLDAIEDDHREAVIQGLCTMDDPTLALIRRYETASLRRLRWALELVQKGKGRGPDPDRRKRWDEDDAPAYDPSARFSQGQPGASAMRAEQGASPRAEHAQVKPESYLRRSALAACTPSTTPPPEHLTFPPPPARPESARHAKQERLIRLNDRKRRAAQALLLAV